MNINIIKIFKKVPWKNGLGFTDELLIEPFGADFNIDNFSYRMSSARISNKSEFSFFNGYKRLLVLLNGAALITHQHLKSGETSEKKLNLFEPYFFSGADKTTAQILTTEDILDFGVIFSPQDVRVDCKILDGRIDFKIDKGVKIFLFCPSSAFIVCDQTVKANELCVITNEKVDTLKFETLSPVIMVLIENNQT